MSSCVNRCGREAVYRVADPGANAVDYCAVDLPAHLAARAATGEFNLLEPVPTTLWVKRATRAFVEVVRSPEGHLLDAGEERPGGGDSGPNDYLQAEPLRDDEPVLELPLGVKPTIAAWRDATL